MPDDKFRSDISIFAKPKDPDVIFIIKSLSRFYSAFLCGFSVEGIGRSRSKVESRNKKGDF